MSFTYGTITTTNATTTTLATIPLTASLEVGVEVWVAGFAPATGDHGVIQLRGAIQTDASSPPVATMIGSYVAQGFVDAGAAAWVVSMSASGSSLLVRVAGDAGKTINWTPLEIRLRTINKPPPTT